MTITETSAMWLRGPNQVLNADPERRWAHSRCTISNKDLAEGHLNRPGTVRVDKIDTLSQSLALRTLGVVKLITVKRIRTLLNTVTKV